MDQLPVFEATGKRKTSIARVRLKAGKGKIEVNGRAFENFFPAEIWRLNILKPLTASETLGKFDVAVNVRGGGVACQSDAVRHGIAKALLEVDQDLRGVLKKEGLLTRDSRIKERKKYGQRGARARFQFSKR